MMDVEQMFFEWKDMGSLGRAIDKVVETINCLNVVGNLGHAIASTKRRRWFCEHA